MANSNNDNNNNNLQFSQNNKNKIWVNKRTNKKLISEDVFSKSLKV